MPSSNPPAKISILTAGKDPHYALGLLEGLVSKPVQIEFLANDEMRSSPVARSANVSYLNLRGDQSVNAPLRQKVFRIVRYYLALLRYAATTDSRLFHILWFNKFEWFDNTLLILFYRLLGKRVVYTVHNVSMKERDNRSGLLDRFSLKCLYRQVDHILVHNAQMKDQVVSGYSVAPGKVTVIPFGVNNVIPRSELTRLRARELLGFDRDRKVLLFFGNIAPYKGLDLLIEALDHLPECHLLIVGGVKGCNDYWKDVEGSITLSGLNGRIHKRIDYVPDEEVEIYFKACDLLVLPYKKIYQSGVIFLSYSFGVPVVATDVGALAESVVEGVTGYVSAANDPRDLASKIGLFFQSKMYRDPDASRRTIIEYVNEMHSWNRVSDVIYQIYSTVGRWD
jgi:glycosyltransferase involved in cell wall biosynthesis